MFGMIEAEVRLPMATNPQMERFYDDGDEVKYIQTAVQILRGE